MQAVYGPEQPVHLAVDPISEVKGIRGCLKSRLRVQIIVV